jgi:hypothetical protein
MILVWLEYVTACMTKKVTAADRSTCIESLIPFFYRR